MVKGNSNELIYGLKLSQGKFYVGKTSDLSKRFDEHKSGVGSAWTKMYKPVADPIILKKPADIFDENVYFMKYALEYGINNVRGDIHCQIVLPEEDIKYIQKSLDSAQDKCYICHKSDHFMTVCPNFENKVINDITITEPITTPRKKQSIKIVDNDDPVTHKDQNILHNAITQPDIYRKMFDECYKQERFESYEYWLSVGMALKNTLEDEDKAVDLFDYYSSKGSNYEGFEKTKYKFKSFTKKTQSGHTVATIYYYAMEDNKPKFIEIMNRNTFELGQTDICKYLKVIAGQKFLYKKTGDVYKLYCFNGKYWENDDTIMRQCISEELYDFLKMVLIQVYWNTKEFNSLKSKIDKLKTISHKKDIIETYKEIGVNNQIKFDEKWNLLGFNNMVYDMLDGRFRDYRYDDYVSLTTGYDWREPTDSEVATMEKLISTIMPIEEDRKLYLQILCTAIDGRCLEKFIIFNGGGGNGKGMINDMLLLALGSYALLGNNAILSETSKTGSNPEKAKIHKKRLVIFREPSEKHKFENAVVKELTGGGSFSARSHYEKETEKELNATIIVECNKKPLFSEDPTNAEIRRIIDLYFRSTFTEDSQKVDSQKHIYLANSMYKTKEFQEKHKFALLKILMTEHIKFYEENNSTLHIPNSVANRTQTYLELSCNILQWFKDTYVSTDSNEICKLKDVFDDFVKSPYYFNLSKMEKRKYNKSFFVDYFETNIFLKEYYCKAQSAHSIKGWKKIEVSDENIVKTTLAL